MTETRKWPADNVERRAVASLIPYARNARTHSEQQVAQIAASIKEWGWTTAVLIEPDGGIIAGHGRVMAAQKLGITEVPCMVATGWTEAQKRAYILADNQLPQNAAWDNDLLKIELGELADLDFDLDLIGFDESELAGFLEKNEGLTDPDATPEVQERAITASGDTWLLGKHRLRCGDSTSADDVAALLNGVEPHLMVTDPPYGVEYDPGWRVKALQGGEKGGTATGKVQNDDRADWREAWALFPGDVAYVWHGERQCGPMVAQLGDCGFEARNLIVWAKPRLAIGRGHYHSQHETCWYAVKGTGHWHGDRKQTTLWQIEHRKSDTGHGTQKPVECMRRPIVNNSSPGQAVYEPFCGSGTTIIAGEMEGRHIYAMELDERYVDVAVKRWLQFTGKYGEVFLLTSDGEKIPYEEVCKMRGVEAA